ncbi:MAG: type II toxin-antitoxin system prevent-host-death family antitoxin [Thermomicrobiales bacterium]
MSKRNPITQTMKASAARQQFSDVINRVYRNQSRILVERSGIPVAAIVPAADLERLDRLERERAERFAGLSRISEAFADVPVDELEREVERAVAARRERVKSAAEA